jgi:sulfonate transport system substrate-binding protein
MKKIAICLLSFVLILVSSQFCFAGQEPTKKDVTIRIAYPSEGTLINGQVGRILEKTDILAKNGLKGEVTAFQYGPPMMEAMLSGRIDVALTSEQNAVVLLAKGFSAKVIASLGSAGRLGLVVPVNSSIKSIKDLKGKKVGTIFGSSVHRPILVWLKEAGLIYGKDVELINMPAAELRFALLNGSLDAIMVWDPYLEDFIEKKNARVIKEQLFNLAVIMSQDFIQKNSDAAVNFLIALKEAALYMATHKKEVNEWYSQLCSLDVLIIDQSSRFNIIYSKAQTLSDINISLSDNFIKTLEDIADFLFSQKLTAKKANIKEGIDKALLKTAEEKLLKR